MSIAALLDRSIMIQRQQVSADASGGSTRVFATLLANVPAAIAPASASVAADYARRDMIVDYHIYFTVDLDAAISGGLNLGDRIADGASFYLVKAVKKSANAAVSSDVLYQVDCQKRT